MTYTEVQNYLHNERKLTSESIQEYNIAFCSKQGYLYASTKFPKEFTQLPEFYFDCLVFPIYDLYNEPIGIMARRMHPSKSKYINSSNDNKFTKSKHLYGLNKAWPYILKENQVIVVEGNFDCIQLQQSGIKNAVSIMGVALSDHQIALLSRFTSNIVLLLDPDKAGSTAGQKYTKVAGKHINCKYINLPTEDDPDEFIIKHGAEALKKHINS